MDADMTFDYDNCVVHEATDIHKLVSTVFSKPPGEPNTCVLDVESTMTPYDIFRMLGQVLTHGIVYLYGNDVRSVDIQLVQSYMNSFGWKVLINPDTLNAGPNVLPYVLKLGVNNQSVDVCFEPFISK